MSETVPKYEVKPLPVSITLSPGRCHVIHQVTANGRRRVVGFFPLEADADAFASMADHFEKLAANPDGTRQV